MDHTKDGRKRSVLSRWGASISDGTGSSHRIIKKQMHPPGIVHPWKC